MSSECLTEPGIVILPTCHRGYENLGLTSQKNCSCRVNVPDRCIHCWKVLDLSHWYMQKGQETLIVSNMESHQVILLLIGFLLAIHKLIEEVFLTGPTRKIRTTLLKEQACSKWC